MKPSADGSYSDEILIGDQNRPIVQYKVDPGSTLVLKGDVTLERCVVRRSMYCTPTLGGVIVLMTMPQRPPQDVFHCHLHERR